MQTTQDDVDAACEALLADGTTPTQRKLHARIGGSFTDLGPMLRIWKEEHAAAEADPVPEALVQALIQLGPRVWGVARQEASSTALRLESERDAARDEAEVERRELMEVIAQLEVDRDAALADARKLKAEGAKSRKGWDAAQAEVIRLEERVAGRDREVERCVAMAEAADARAAQAEAREADMRAEMAALQARPVDDEAGTARHAAE